MQPTSPVSEIPPVVWYRQPKAPPSRVPGWMTTTVLVVLAGGLFLTGVGTAGALALGFAILTPIERRWRRHEQPVRRPGLRTDMFHLLLSGALSTVCVVVPVVVWAVLLSPFMRFGPSTAFRSLPTPAQIAIAFTVIELFGYLVHRAEHEVALLWRFHAVHHSSRHLDWIAGARLHPMEGFVIGAIVAPPLLWLGVGPAPLGAFGVFTQLWAVLLHMNVRWRLRWLDGIWSTTDYHHWHHSNHPEARNRNYSAFLPVIDKVFGTYYMPADRRPRVYGIDEPMPDGWWRQLRHPFHRRPTGLVP